MKKINVPETERIVFIPDSYGSNMSLKYGYSNIGFFSSGRNRNILKAMYRLGYNVQMDEQLWITSYSGTFLNYSMAGVKYYITKQKLDDTIFEFEFDEKFEDFYIYKNRNQFNIGFFLENDVEESYNPLKMQNDLLKAMISKNAENNYFEAIENAEDILKCDKKLIFDEHTGEYTITYNLKALDDCSIYIASDHDLQVYVNGEELFEHYSNIWSTETGVKQIKHLEFGEEFEFTIKTKQNLELLYVGVSNNNKIQELLNIKDEKNVFSNVIVNSNGLEGIADFENDGFLCFSINYDEGWKVYVDEKEAEKTAIAKAFLGVRLERGKHIISIEH